MNNRAFGLLTAAILGMATANAASVNAPHVPDARFNHGVPILEAFHATSPGLITGQKLARDESSGDTVMAGLIPVSDSGETRYTVVIARYGADGGHKLWTGGTSGAVDASKKYVFVPYNTSPAYVRAVAVRDVVVGIYGDINVLVDTRGVGASASISSVVATFGSTGEYKGVVTHMAQAGVDNVGASILPWGSNGFVVSSQPDIGDWPSGARLVIRKYSVNLSNGVPAFDTSWGNAGKVELTLPLCTKLGPGTPPIILPVNCDLRVERAEVPGSGTAMFIAGDYEAKTAGSSSGDRELFVMKVAMANGALVSAFGNGGVVTYGSASLDEKLRGLVVRKMAGYPSASELYLLERFKRPCGYGFIVPHFNAETGAYINRSYTMVGGSNADPSVCAQTDSLVAEDMTLPKSYTTNSQYLGVVGAHVHAEMYTGADAFLALLDIDDLHATPQLQDFTHNAGQFPSDSRFNAVFGNVDDGATFTAVGTDQSYDGDLSTAMTVRMRPDRIFRDGFGG